MGVIVKESSEIKQPFFTPHPHVFLTLCFILIHAAEGIQYMTSKTSHRYSSTMA
jgi:hypothetical protein